MRQQSAGAQTRQYRTLTFGERMEPGDECLAADATTWLPIPAEDLGRPWVAHQAVRRCTAGQPAVLDHPHTVPDTCTSILWRGVRVPLPLANRPRPELEPQDVERWARACGLQQGAADTDAARLRLAALALFLRTALASGVAPVLSDLQVAELLRLADDYASDAHAHGALPWADASREVAARAAFKMAVLRLAGRSPTPTV